jgi:hypothetical protein
VAARLAGALSRLQRPRSTCLRLLAVLLVRLLISANNFYLSWRAGSVTPPDHALNPLSAASLFWQEFHSSMLTSSYYMLRPIGLQLRPARAACRCC